MTFPIKTVGEDSILKEMALGILRNVGMAVPVESNTNPKKGTTRCGEIPHVVKNKIPHVNQSTSHS